MATPAEKTAAAKRAAEQLARLREPFSAAQVKTRPGGRGKQLDYVPIEGYLERLLDAAPESSWEGTVEHITFAAPGEAGCTAVVSGHLVIGEKRAFGVGSMTNSDPDMAVKSANSEAIKNAAKNGWGVSLELWSEEHRDKLSRQRALLSGSESALKAAVREAATERLGHEPKSWTEVAEVCGVAPGELADPEVLKTILKGEGKL